MNVYLLWHIHHLRDSPVEHRDADGNVQFLDGTDDEKMIGVDGSEELATEAATRARLLPGFRDEPNCFLLEAQTLNEDHWLDGYVTV